MLTSAFRAATARDAIIAALTRTRLARTRRTACVFLGYEWDGEERTGTDAPPPDGAAPSGIDRARRRRCNRSRCWRVCRGARPSRQRRAWRLPSGEHEPDLRLIHSTPFSINAVRLASHATDRRATVYPTNSTVTLPPAGFLNHSVSSRLRRSLRVDCFHCEYREG
jgi:hypothetical protein